MTPTDADATASPALASLRTPDADWLSELLGTRIRTLKSDLIGTSRGFVSTTWRLELEAEPPGSAPASLVLKSESGDPTFQALAREQSCFEREIRFYSELAPRLGARLPQIHACSSGNDSYWLLMEDLCHLRAGDQVRGLSHAEARAVVRQMAAVHAAFWMDARLNELAWLPSHSFWFQHPDPSLVEPFLRDYGLRLGGDLVTLVRRVIEQEEAIDAAIRQRPWTLVHGDLRADNLLFDGADSAPQPVLLDWQGATRSLATVDLAFLLGGSEPVAERAGHLDELLYLWHGDLVAHGVSDYGLAEARHDLQLAALGCLGAAVKLYGLLTGPDLSVRAALFHDQAIQRHCAVVMELKAWQALPTPLSGG